MAYYKPMIAHACVSWDLYFVRQAMDLFHFCLFKASTSYTINVIGPIDLD